MSHLVCTNRDGEKQGKMEIWKQHTLIPGDLCSYLHMLMVCLYSVSRTNLYGSLLGESCRQCTLKHKWYTHCTCSTWGSLSVPKDKDMKHSNKLKAFVKSLLITQWIVFLIVNFPCHKQANSQITAKSLQGLTLHLATCVINCLQFCSQSQI